MIVISHVTETLVSSNTLVDFQEYVFPIGIATTDIRAIIFMLFYQFGMLGNNIFFICSAYFFVGREKSQRKKAFSLICTVWVISIVVLGLYLGVLHYNIPLKSFVRQIFPTTCSNNWFLTCYIIFLFVFPYLNKLIAHIEQKGLLRIVLFSSLLWIVADYFYRTLFFPSRVILWITVYFLVAYLKLYCNHIMSSLKAGYVLIIVGITGFIGQVLVANYVGLHVGISDNVLRWNNNCNPFYIMIALGSLIIALSGKSKSLVINYISSLTLFIYLFHENYMFTNYTRPLIWQWFFVEYGYQHVILFDLVFSFVVFIATIIISIVYKETVQRLVNYVSDKLYLLVRKQYKKIEDYALSRTSSYI